MSLVLFFVGDISLRSIHTPNVLHRKNIFEYGYFLFYKGSIVDCTRILEHFYAFFGTREKNIRIGERYCWLLVFGSREKLKQDNIDELILHSPLNFFLKGIN
jgi:hypothetical protein